MSMQSYLRKASKKLVEDPEAAPEEGEGETPAEHKTATPKSQSKSKASGGAMHSAPAMHKKGTRKKI